MKNNIIISIICLLLIIGSCQRTNQLVLVDNAKSDYQIVISENSSSFEMNAALELQYYIQEVSAVNLEIITDAVAPTEYEIVLGYTNRKIPMEFLSEVEQLDEDGFIIRTIGGRLIIAGGDEMGTLYGVYTFLEDVVGCEWCI